MCLSEAGSAVPLEGSSDGLLECGWWSKKATVLDSSPLLQPVGVGWEMHFVIAFFGGG